MTSLDVRQKQGPGLELLSHGKPPINISKIGKGFMEML